MRPEQAIELYYQDQDQKEKDHYNKSDGWNYCECASCRQGNYDSCVKYSNGWYCNDSFI